MNAQSFADTIPITTPSRDASENLSRGALTKTHALTPTEISQVLAALPEDIEWTRIRGKLYAQLHRKVRSRGERHHRAKLTDREAQLMRECRVRYGWGYKRLAEKFETSKSNAVSICKGRTRRVPSPEEIAGYT